MWGKYPDAVSSWFAKLSKSNRLSSGTGTHVTAITGARSLFTTATPTAQPRSQNLNTIGKMSMFLSQFSIRTRGFSFQKFQPQTQLRLLNGKVLLSTIKGTSVTNNNTNALVEKAKLATVTRQRNRETATIDHGFNHGLGFEFVYFL